MKLLGPTLMMSTLISVQEQLKYLSFKLNLGTLWSKHVVPLNWSPVTNILAASSSLALNGTWPVNSEAAAELELPPPASSDGPIRVGTDEGAFINDVPIEGVGGKPAALFWCRQRGKGEGVKNAQNVVVTDILYEWSLMAMMMMWEDGQKEGERGEVDPPSLPPSPFLHTTFLSLPRPLAPRWEEPTFTVYPQSVIHWQGMKSSSRLTLKKRC